MNTFVESLKETNKIETSYISDPFKFTLLGLLGKQTVYKKQVNVISSNILEGRGRGKVVIDSCRVHIPGMVTSCHL